MIDFSYVVFLILVRRIEKLILYSFEVNYGNIEGFRGVGN